MLKPKEYKSQVDTCMKVMSILETSFQEKTLGWSYHVEMCNRKLLVVG
jgi:hypothetical protein